MISLLLFGFFSLTVKADDGIACTSEDPAKGVVFDASSCSAFLNLSPDFGPNLVGSLACDGGTWGGDEGHVFNIYQITPKRLDDGSCSLSLTGTHHAGNPNIVLNIPKDANDKTVVTATLSGKFLSNGKKPLYDKLFCKIHDSNILNYANQCVGLPQASKPQDTSTTHSAPVPIATADTKFTLPLKQGNMIASQCNPLTLTGYTYDSNLFCKVLLNCKDFHYVANLKEIPLDDQTKAALSAVSFHIDCKTQEKSCDNVSIQTCINSNDDKLKMPPLPNPNTPDTQTATGAQQ